MAKFTSPLPLNIRYEGHDFIGSVGDTYRLPDSLRAAFDAEFGSRVRPIWVVDDEIGAGGGGGHPDLAAHTSLGLIAASHATAADPHVAYALDADLANHEADTTAVHGIADTATISLNTHTHGAIVHTHPQSSITNLVSDLAGKAASVHTHAYSTLTSIPATFVPTAHSHDDGDLPAGLARDSEVTSAIDTHAATPHGGSLPAGLIVMWGGAVTAIPAGWLLCDGLNGTPDLRSRFIKGAAAGANPGATGGAATHTHAGHAAHVVTQPSAHSAHVFTQPAAHTDHASHTHTSASAPATPDLFTTNTATSGVGMLTGGPSAALTHSAHSGGAVDAHSAHSGTAVDAHSAHDSPNSEPAYYALAFIQKS